MAEQLGSLGGGNARIGKLELFVRVRPATPGADICMHEMGAKTDANTIELRDPSYSNSAPRTFACTRVFPHDSSQLDLLSHLGTPIADWLWDGFCALVLGYGQSGTGKTHSLFGGIPSSSRAHQEGLLTRIVTELLERSQGGQFTLGLQCWEIRGEKTVDLLSEYDASSLGASDVTSVLIEAPRDVTSVLSHSRRASVNWRNGSEETNDSQALPNRAHAFVRLTIFRTGEAHVSTLTVVDPVGFEPVARPSVQGPVSSQPSDSTSPDFRHSNRKAKRDDQRSLAALSRLLSEVSQHCEDAARGKVPSRLLTGPRTTLTNHLLPCLTHNCKTFLLATISPDADSYLETLNTLRVATRARAVVTPCVKTQGRPLDRLALQSVWKLLSRGGSRAHSRARSPLSETRSEKSTPPRKARSSFVTAAGSARKRDACNSEKPSDKEGGFSDDEGCVRKGGRYEKSTKSVQKEMVGTRQLGVGEPTCAELASRFEQMASPKQVEDWDIIAHMAKLDSLLSPNAVTRGKISPEFSPQYPVASTSKKTAEKRVTGNGGLSRELESPQESVHGQTPNGKIPPSLSRPRVARVRERPEGVREPPKGAQRARPRKTSAVEAMESLDEEFKDVFARLGGGSLQKEDRASLAGAREGSSLRGHNLESAGPVSDLATKSEGEIRRWEGESLRKEGAAFGRSGDETAIGDGRAESLHNATARTTADSTGSQSNQERRSSRLRDTVQHRLERVASPMGGSIDSPQQGGKSPKVAKALARGDKDSPGGLSITSRKGRSSVDKLDRTRMDALTNSLIASVAERRERNGKERGTGNGTENGTAARAEVGPAPLDRQAEGKSPGREDLPRATETFLGKKKQAGEDLETVGSPSVVSSGKRECIISETPCGEVKGQLEVSGREKQKANAREFLESNGNPAPVSSAKKEVKERETVCTKGDGQLERLGRAEEKNGAQKAEDGRSAAGDYASLLVLLQRERKEREEVEGRVAELENELLETSTSYSLKVDDLRLDLHKTRARCRALEGASSHSTVFEQYDQELRDLRHTIRDLRNESKEASAQHDLELARTTQGGTFRSGSDEHVFVPNETISDDHLAGTAHFEVARDSQLIPRSGDASSLAKSTSQSKRCTVGSLCASEGRAFELLQREVRQLRHEKEGLERDLTAARQDTRHVAIQRRAAEDAICRSDALARRTAALEEEVLSLQLRERAAIGGLQHAQRAVDVSAAAEALARRECAELGELVRTLRDEIYAVKRARRSDLAISRMTGRGTRSGSPTKRKPCPRLPFDTLARLQRSLEPNAKRALEIVSELTRELGSVQQELTEDQERGTAALLGRTR